MLNQTDQPKPSTGSGGRRTPPPPDPASRMGPVPGTEQDRGTAHTPVQEGPPPPPIPPRLPTDDGTSRSTAATWVGATGAFLLLVAAAIFLAVSWDVLGITARIAVVASVTAAAIVGGHRLGRVLPAVGAVIFHLGALLLPVDAAGLALQLDLSVATAWTLTGAVTVLALPPLAMVGRSRTLAAAAIVGVPILATGIGLAGAADPALVVAGAGLLALVVLRLRGTRVARIWRGSPVALASTAVLLPLVAVVLDTTLARGQVVTAVRTAGWAPTSWVTPAIVGVLAVGTVAVCARLTRSRQLAALVPVLGAVATLVTLLPEATPRLALLLVGPMILLLIEIVALVLADEPRWGTGAHWTAGAIEVAAGVATFGVLPLIIVPDLVLGEAVDAELAAALGLAVVGFLVAALRRVWPRRPLDGVAVALTGLAVLHGAAALTAALAGGRSPLTATLLLAAVAVALIPAVTSGGAAGTTGAADPARVGVVLVVAVLACAAAWNTAAALPVAVFAAPLVGLHVRALLVRDHGSALVVAGMAAPMAAMASLLLAAFPGEAGGMFATGDLQAQVLQAGLATLALLSTACIIDRAPVVADVLRAFGVAVVSLAVGIAGVPMALREGIVTLEQSVAIDVLTPVPALLVVLAPAAVWLVLDAVRLQRVVIAVLAAPVVARLTASIVVGFGASPVVLGAVLLGFGLVAATIALTTRLRNVRAGLSVLAVLTVLPGWALLGATPEARAIALVALGLAGVAVGVVRRNQFVGHGGGIVATIGIWLWFDLQAVTAVDIWMLPVALHLVVAGWRTRREGTITSWVLDVPPLLLVALPAIGERLADGSGVHALLAGTVAIVAVVYGGAAGRGGPLLGGIAVLIAVIVVETIAYAALVPTWAWFALAGSVLIGSAVLIERKGLSPSRAVDRLKGLAGDDPAGSAAEGGAAVVASGPRGHEHHDRE